MREVDGFRPVPSMLVWRQVPFSVEAFDRFKDWQRLLERQEGRRVSNGEALERLILSHPQVR